MAGLSASHFGWMSEFGESIPISLERHGEFPCSQTGIGID